MHLKNDPKMHLKNGPKCIKNGPQIVITIKYELCGWYYQFGITKWAAIFLFLPLIFQTIYNSINSL